MRRHLFSDEAGDFEFAKKQNVSKYFIACAVDIEDCDVGLQLLRLRRDLAWEEQPVGDHFQACTDKQVVRDRVFGLISRLDLKIYVQVLEKSPLGSGHETLLLTRRWARPRCSTIQRRKLRVALIVDRNRATAAG